MGLRDSGAPPPIWPGSMSLRVLISEIRSHVEGWKGPTLGERDTLFHCLPVFLFQVHGSASRNGFFQGQIQLVHLPPELLGQVPSFPPFFLTLPWDLRASELRQALDRPRHTGPRASWEKDWGLGGSCPPQLANCYTLKLYPIPPVSSLSSSLSLGDRPHS